MIAALFIIERTDWGIRVTAVKAGKNLVFFLVPYYYISRHKGFCLGQHGNLVEAALSTALNAGNMKIMLET